MLLWINHFRPEMKSVQIDINAAIVAIVVMSICSCSLPSEVTPEVRGKVINSITRQPISCASIRVTHPVQRDAFSEGMSSSDGHFTVSPAHGYIYPLGTAIRIEGDMVIAAPGYSTIRTTILASRSTGYRYCDLSTVTMLPRRTSPRSE